MANEVDSAAASCQLLSVNYSHQVNSLFHHDKHHRQL